MSEELSARHVLKMTYRDRTLEVPGFDDGDHIPEYIRATGKFYEVDILEAIETLIGKGGVFLDAGGFIGTHSLFFASVMNMSGYSVEPEPISFRHLVENIAANGLQSSVQAVNCALWSATAELNNLGAPPGNRGMNSVSIRQAQPAGSPASTGGIRAIAADTLVPPDRRIALFKIDVEGAEMEVLAGARRILSMDRPLVCIEARTENEARVQTKLLEDGFGYRLIGIFCATPTLLFIARGSQAEQRLAELTLVLSRTIRTLNYGTN